MKPHKIFWIGLFLIISYLLKLFTSPLPFFLMLEFIFFIIAVMTVLSTTHKDEGSILEYILVFNSILMFIIGILLTIGYWVARRKFWKKININKFNNYLDDRFSKRK